MTKSSSLIRSCNGFIHCLFSISYLDLGIMQSDKICKRGYSRLSALIISKFELLTSSSEILAFEIKPRLQLYYQSIAILYILDVFFSNSYADFFLLLKVETDFFL